MMNKKFLYTLLALVLMTASVSAQRLSKETQSDITKTVAAFIKSTINNDYEGVLKHTYPKLFTMASKEDMLASLQGMEAMGLHMLVDEMGIKRIEALHETEKDQYALVNYTTKMRIGLSGQLAEPNAMASMEESFKNTYGKDNVSFDEENKQFNVSGEKFMVLIKEEAYGPEWYIMEWNDEIPEVISALLSKEVIEKATKRIKP
ncbi:hypothetical protein [Roseivirga sp.]|uniref:hypothetical protein n=1 Tax=Roseivirga sp. TaxID=1964215 RepID=UPI003B8C67C3